MFLPPSRRRIDKIHREHDRSSDWYNWVLRRPLFDCFIRICLFCFRRILRRTSEVIVGGKTGEMDTTYPPTYYCPLRPFSVNTTIITAAVGSTTAVSSPIHSCCGDHSEIHVPEEAHAVLEDRTPLEWNCLLIHYFARGPNAKARLHGAPVI